MIVNFEHVNADWVVSRFGKKKKRMVVFSGSIVKYHFKDFSVPFLTARLKLGGILADISTILVDVK